MAKTPTNPRYEKRSPTMRIHFEDVPSKYGPPGGAASGTEGAAPGTLYERQTIEIKCCGQWLRCDRFTNTCRCGADYNGSGQRLAPREQWGEETGEHWTDIIRIR